MLEGRKSRDSARRIEVAASFVSFATRQKQFPVPLLSSLLTCIRCHALAQMILCKVVLSSIHNILTCIRCHALTQMILCKVVLSSIHNILTCIRCHALAQMILHKVVLPNFHVLIIRLLQNRNFSCPCLKSNQDWTI
jgi:hypothetical protein